LRNTVSCWPHPLSCRATSRPLLGLTRRTFTESSRCHRERGEGPALSGDMVRAGVEILPSSG
jgi:hypothetical protein